PRLPGPRLGPAAVHGERHHASVDTDLAVPGGLRAAVPGPGARPAPPLDVPSGLRGRDLGEVLDVTHPQFTRCGDQSVVAVDGEVAQRVRARRRGGGEDERADGGQDGGARGEGTARGHRLASRSFSAAFASRAPSGENPGFSRSAAVREARAARWSPTARSIMPRWWRNAALR